ncbi:MAG: hypothetical protein ACP5LC_05080, partial [Thermoplasmata archaeon]
NHKVMSFDDANRKMLSAINRLKFINDDIYKLQMKKKELSDKIIEISKGGTFSEDQINNFMQELSELEKQKFYLETEKNHIVGEIKGVLENKNVLLDRSMEICNLKGIMTVSGLPGIGKTETILKMLNNCNERDKLIVVLRDRERIEKLVNEFNIDAKIYFINPIYTKKKLDIRSIDQVSKIANRLANDINKVLGDKRNPVIVIHRSNDISLDRIDEISGIIKEEFWSSFLQALATNEKEYLIIFNCDDINEECTNLLSFSDYLLTVKYNEGNINIYLSRTRL